MGVVRLAKPFGSARVDAACLRTLEIGAKSYGSVKSILDNRLDGQTALRRRRPPGGDDQALPSAHANIRGSRYYH